MLRFKEEGVEVAMMKRRMQQNQENIPKIKHQPQLIISKILMVIIGFAWIIALVFNHSFFNQKVVENQVNETGIATVVSKDLNQELQKNMQLEQLNIFTPDMI